MRQLPVLNDLPFDHPLYLAGLRSGDKIMSIAGSTVDNGISTVIEFQKHTGGKCRRGGDVGWNSKRRHGARALGNESEDAYGLFRRNFISPPDIFVQIRWRGWSPVSRNAATLSRSFS